VVKSARNQEHNGNAKTYNGTRECVPTVYKQKMNKHFDNLRRIMISCPYIPAADVSQYEGAADKIPRNRVQSKSKQNPKKQKTKRKKQLHALKNITRINFENSYIEEPNINSHFPRAMWPRICGFLHRHRQNILQPLTLKPTLRQKDVLPFIPGAASFPATTRRPIISSIRTTPATSAP